ncbi:MAG: YdiU family protein [Hydrocarboniphaga sp.]|uniref:protein adenylyltransferase SelO n=1 Tax=Hydrocarboniphaga sp. TaxID=2033016 RepID=UPI002611498C|nr:YdiU family protein [Hydrocarboniphaga sp.]MDB5969740.1 YdiU family protein [Hydrocarboniphaga sp.]
MKLHARLDDLPFENHFERLDPAYYSRVDPAPLSDVRLLHFNAGLAAELGLDSATAGDAGLTEALAGNRKITAGCYLATVYAGHQFGSYVPQLGDGRAIMVGQVRDARGGLRELQLKGAGPTPYSRFADGRAVLRSSIREYLCGEAMHALGIATTRSLSLIGSSLPVRRETLERAAVICRVAPSHVRFGHFEYFYLLQRHEMLKPLADLVIDDHYPELAGFPNRYAAWLSEVVERTARTIAQWQAVGFCHGVMNTDNMSVLGLTLDYGPYGFLDAFDSHHICNHTDEGGRYAYDQQPTIGHWNCSRLLQATLPLLHEDPDQAVEIANGILNRYPAAYTTRMMELWRAKFGLRSAQEADRELINRFLNLLDRGKNDFSLSFRALGELRIDAASTPLLRDLITDREGFDAWLADYRARLQFDGEDEAARRARMHAVNPKYLLRNHLLQAAIERAEAGDADEIDRLFRIVQRPFDEQPENQAYAAEPPPEARHISVSCSS